MQLATALLGGLLIGLSAIGMLWVTGRIAGISGIFRGLLLPKKGDSLWRLAFISGLVVGGLLMGLLMPSQFPSESIRPPILLALGGLLVGFGTRLGSGCTSGHGVCGLGRFSMRSLFATLTFISTGVMTVFIVDHLLQGAL